MKTSLTQDKGDGRLTMQPQRVDQGVYLSREHAPREKEDGHGKG